MNKLRIAQSFSRAADTYDQAAYLQREIGECLFAKIPPNNVDTVVDLGCGTGFFTNALLERFPTAQVCGVDIAKGMLDFAKTQFAQSAHWVCADAESLPLRDDSIDLIFSNLAIQWCEHIDQLLSEIKRALKPGGAALLSTLGSSTLKELKQSWQLTDNRQHVNYFLSEENIKTQISNINFSDVGIVNQFKTLHYQSPVELMRELKELGAHELTQKRSAGLMGKKRFNDFLDHYKSVKNESGFPATYEVIYIMLRK